MKSVLVIAPHADDETLGCGGALLRHRAEGAETHWLLLCGPDKNTPSTLGKAYVHVDEIAKAYDFSSVHQAGLPIAGLDSIPITSIVDAIAKVVKQVKPDTLYLPFEGDAHTDHRVAFSAAAACTKWFRYPSVKRVLAYETISETDFALAVDGRAFRPNVYLNISQQLERKMDILNIYRSEMGEFPFPRSEKAVRALASLRGSSAGFEAAEAFMLLKEIR